VVCRVEAEAYDLFSTHALVMFGEKQMFSESAQDSRTQVMKNFVSVVDYHESPFRRGSTEEELTKKQAPDSEYVCNRWTDELRELLFTNNDNSLLRTRPYRFIDGRQFVSCRPWDHERDRRSVAESRIESTIEFRRP